MARPLHEQVVVLTGASSGIGRATAVALAGRGATVVLAARSAEQLEAVAAEVKVAGGRAEVVPTDVAEWPQVEALARTAVERCGRIDTWINNAAVSMYATVENSTIEEIERILRVGLFGMIYGMKAALPVMKRQNGGTIMNVSSILGKFSVPLQAAYCAAKHGIIGFADALRLELAREHSPIQVCSILPGSTNTPFFEHARAKLGGRRPMPLPPIYEPEVVAETIAFACEQPRREVLVGGAGKMFELLYRVNPALLDWVMLINDTGAKGQIADKPDDGRDNLFAPSGGDPAHGTYGDGALWSSAYTRWVELHPTVKGVLVGAGVLGVAGLLGGLGRKTVA
jgi:NAD(P)-dependent dehydrogenase (short-subunit alcohol dehydrogenase family)